MKTLIKIAKSIVAENYINTYANTPDPVTELTVTFQRAFLSGYDGDKTEGSYHGCKLQFSFLLREGGGEDFMTDSKTFDFGTIGFKTEKGWLSSKSVVLDIKDVENLTADEIKIIMPFVCNDVKVFKKRYPSDNSFGAWAQVMSRFTPFAEIGSGTYTECNMKDGEFKATYD